MVMSIVEGANMRSVAANQLECYGFGELFMMFGCFLLNATHFVVCALALQAAISGVAKGRGGLTIFWG